MKRKNSEYKRQVLQYIAPVFYIHYFATRMVLEDKKLNKSTILIISILLLFGAALRLWHLDYQSMWLDEMHTMLFADPEKEWTKYWAEIGADVHPPLHYTLLKVLFSTIAYTSVMARIVSAIAGILSIWAIFLLGREIKDNKLGLVAASITVLNYYCISFSQEARNYMLAFLLVTLSFLYLIRLLKTLKLKHSIWYGIYTMLLLYCHYYAVFVICAQIITGLIFFANEEKGNRILFIKRFLLSAAIVAIGFSPWIQFLTSVTEAKSTWIPMPSNRFIIEYFNEYFGNSEILVPIFAGCLLYFVICVFIAPWKGIKLKNNTILLCFVVCFLWISITYLLPYLRSLTALPMLYGRYTIVVLPGIIMCIAYGIVQMKYKLIVVAVLGTILVESFIDLAFKKDYYTRITKTQFREMVGYVCRNYYHNEIIFDEVCGLHQRYYFKQFGVKPNMLDGTKVALIDSVLTPGSFIYNVNTFWILGGHHEDQIDDNTRHRLEEKYDRISNAQFVDAWAEYYVAKTDTGTGMSFIDYRDVAAKNDGLTPDNEVKLYKDSVQFKPRNISKGKYHFIISVRGTVAHDFYPNLSISLNGKRLGDLQTTEGNCIGIFYWETPNDTQATFTITLTNDDTDAENNADRNAFIKNIRITKLD